MTFFVGVFLKKARFQKKGKKGLGEFLLLNYDTGFGYSRNAD